MIADNIGIPPIPSMNETVGGLSFQCSACGKNVKSATSICDNPSCSNPTAKKIVKPKNRPDENGAKPFLQQHETVYMGMPVTNMHVPGTIPVAAQTNTQLLKPSLPQQQTPIPKVKPIKNRRLLSDDDAQVVDPDHLDNCSHSADHLGL